MLFRDLFESDEHFDMAHEVLTAHELQRNQSPFTDKISYNKQHDDYPSMRDTQDSIKNTLRSMGWRSWRSQPESQLPVDYLSHKDSPHKYLAIKSHRHGNLTVDVNNEHPDKGGMHGTIQTLGENEVAANCAGSGAVEGMGVGPKGEPGFPKSKKKRGLTMRGILSVKGIVSDGVDGK